VDETKKETDCDLAYVAVSPEGERESVNDKLNEGDREGVPNVGVLIVRV